MMNILLVEDEVKLRKSLSKGLTEQGMNIETAENGKEGLEKLCSNSFDVIVSDRVMPIMDGIEFTINVRERGIKTPILLLTALGSTEDKVTGLESGADDYLVKPFEFKELLARIKALSRRQVNSLAPKPRVKYSDIELNTESFEVFRNGHKLNLTTKEFALLEYFMKYPEKLITKTELYENVWDIDFDTNTNVVEVYINYLRNKVDKPFEKKLIHTVFGAGYILKENN